MSVEELRESYDEVGDLHPIIVDKATGEIVSGKTRAATGRPWRRYAIEFPNRYRLELTRAAENLHRRELGEDEKREIVKRVQESHHASFGRYLTQGEAADRLKRSPQWVSLYWNEAWTHTTPVTGEPADKYSRSKAPVIGAYTPEKPCKDYTPEQATQRLLELRKTGDATPLNKEFNALIRQVPDKVVSRLYQSYPDEKVVEALGEPEIVKPVVRIDDELRRRWAEQGDVLFKPFGRCVECLSDTQIQSLREFLR